MSRDTSGSPALSRRTVLVGVLVVLTVYAAALVFLGGDEARDALRRVRWPPVLTALGLQVVVTLTWPLVHRASLHAVGADATYSQALQTSMSAFTVSHAIPGGGAVGAAVAVDRLNRFGIEGPIATASAALTGLLSLVTIGLLGAGGITAAVVLGDLDRIVLLPAGGVLLALLAVSGGIVAGLHSPGAGHRVIDALGRVHRRIRRHTDDWHDSWETVTAQAPTATDLAKVIGWSGAKWTADVASLAMVFVAFDQTPRLSMLLVGFGVSQLLASIPATPGAVGIVEGGMLGVFAAFGVPLGTATLVAVTYRVIEAWLPTLAGVPVLLSAPSRR